MDRVVAGDLNGQAVLGAGALHVAHDVAAQIVEQQPRSRPRDLVRYHLGMVKDEAEPAALEEHILACGLCADRAAAVQDHVDAMRVAALEFSDPTEAPTKRLLKIPAPDPKRNVRGRRLTDSPILGMAHRCIPRGSDGGKANGEQTNFAGPRRLHGAHARNRLDVHRSLELNGRAHIRGFAEKRGQRKTG